MYAGGKNPQYRYYGYLNQYTNRISHLISGGTHVASAAVVYHAEAEWSGSAMYFHKPVKVLMQHQIDCEVVPVDTLLEAAYVQDNKLHVNREDYSCLIVPYAEALPAAMIQRLVQFAEQGLSIRFVDGLPERSSEGIDVSGELSLLSVHPNVKTCELRELAQNLTADGYYDVKAQQYEPYLRNYHYTHDDLDVFMFFNESPNQMISTKIVLPVQGDVYAYNAFLNKIKRLEAIGQSGAGTVELVLHPYESIILLHGPSLKDYPACPPQMAAALSLELKGEWTVSIADADHYPQFREWGKTTTLKNMSGPDNLPGFSGTFRYETEFEWNESSNGVLLELGEVYETAEVWLNNGHTGVRICPPYCLEINGLLKKGKNKLVIEVTNTLVKDQRDFLSSFAQQEPSGLIGPVQVLSTMISEE